MHCPSPSDLTRTNVWVLMKKKIFFCSCRYVMVTYGRNAYSVVARPDSARHGKDLIIGSSYFLLDCCIRNARRKMGHELGS